MPLRRSSKSVAENVAYMQEADDASGTVDETADVTYATSQAPSPTKEKMNISRKKKARADSSSPANGLTDSDSTVHPRRESKSKSSQRDKEKTTSTHRKSVTLSTPTRPSTKHSKTTPVIENSTSRRKRDESMYYGESDQHLVMPAGALRPRGYTTGPRPSSYYGSSSRPPISNTRYHPTSAPAPLVPTSYPPPSWQAAGLVSYPAPQPAYQQDYFAPQQRLQARFDRPSTAIGHRAPTSFEYAADAYPVEDTRGLSRRLSLTRRSRQEEERRQMPPPPRPSSARPISLRPSAFAPPPTERRRSIRYEDDAFEGDGSMYHDVSPPTPYEQPAPRLPRPRRPSVGAQSIVYDSGPWTAEIAGSRSRRNSYFGEATAGYEDKYQQAASQAASYQNDVMGGAPAPLTAESLRKASKTSSRSTRSTASHDDSWRRSHTTGTTRSSNEEDVTIRVKGGATLEYGGAKMQCKDGAEINIRQASGGRSGSDQSSYVDGDRRTRVNQSVNHKRASSQAASYSRTKPVAYDYSGGYSYDYSAPASGIPYPSQPQGWL